MSCFVPNIYLLIYYYAHFAIIKQKIITIIKVHIIKKITLFREDDLMELNKCIEYALHSYDIFWDYYKKTLDERNQILNNYLLFIGIPISIVGIIVENKIAVISQYSLLIALVLIVILSLGIVIYDAYIVESFISERYLQQIRKITNYLILNYDNTYNNVFKKTYTLNHLFLNETASQTHRIRKSFVIVIINTVITVGIVCLIFFNYTRWYHILISFIISIFIHIIIFIYNKQSFCYNNTNLI